MKRAITLPDLKKRLKAMEKSELEQLVYDIYKENKAVEQALCLKFLGRDYGEKLFDEYDVKLQKIFYPKDIVRTGFSSKVANAVLKEFLDICGDEWLRAKCKLYFVAYGVDLIDTYGGAEERLYDYILDYFCQVTEYASKDREFFEKHQDLMQSVVRQTEFFGYGLYDGMDYEYSSLLD